ncbi:hypothetical protein M422DRAFT_249104 [Sphaerobolus stellatus SS14]|nr:hypothetical protein M422DRAFT_249104 [Sphaerobolus stellatus SS14]
MGLKSLDSLRDVMVSANLQEIISDVSLGKAVVTKPSSSGTLHRLQIVILALPVIKSPVRVRVNWIGSNTETLAENRGKYHTNVICNSTSASAASWVYALDSVYSAGNDDLQYLEWHGLG